MEYITLSNGVKMPQLGYGVYQVTKDECERCVLDALDAGYRSIDTAQSYFNENEVLRKIGQKYGKTTAQVMLRWHIQRGVIVIPKSVHKERMIENMQVFDFALDAEDMQAITEMDRKESAFFSHQDPAMVEWFVRMVEERKTQHDSSKEKKNW